MRLIVRVTPLRVRAGSADRIPCPSENEFESLHLGLLSVAQAGKIKAHCSVCESCRQKRDLHEICLYEMARAIEPHWAVPSVGATGASAPAVLQGPSFETGSRLLAGVAAASLLIGIVQMHPGDAPTDFGPVLPTMFGTPGEIASASTAPRPEEDFEAAEIRKVQMPRRTETEDPLEAVALAGLVGPRRPFIAPQTTYRLRYVSDRVTIDPPVLLARASLRMPELPLHQPELRPPNKKGIKKFFSAIGNGSKRFVSKLAGPENTPSAE